MKVITLLNEKGGVGKTTKATAIAAGLAQKGVAVVLLDADPQAHATNVLSMPEKPMLYDLLIRDANWQDCMLPAAGYGKLWIVPGNIETRGIPLHLSDAFKLEMRLRQLEGIVDVAVIDTPPTPSLFHSAILLASDYVLHPTQCEYLSIDGLQKSISHVWDFSTRKEREGLPGIGTLGIIPTMFDPRTLEHAENLAALKTQYGEYVWSQINRRVVWTEAARAGKPVWEYAPGTEAAREALEMVERVHKAVA